MKMHKKDGLLDTDSLYGQAPMFGEISDYNVALQLQRVDQTECEAFWDEMVSQHHYLGYNQTFGDIKYIALLGDRVVGAISYSHASYHLAPRDEYVGWDKTTKESLLPHLINNNRFLILPWIYIRNLASKILSLSLAHVRTDWYIRYGVRPYMAETFVDRTQFHGTCYRASNWVYLGETKGYSRAAVDRYDYHGQKKDIYVILIDKTFMKQFKPDINRLNKDREEVITLLNGVPMWYETLLHEVGIKGNVVKQINGLLADHTAPYLSYLGRKEHKEHFITYLVGLMSDLQRKSAEPIAIAYQGADVARNLSRFMSGSKWDTDAMKAEYQDNSAATLSDQGAMITLDGCDMAKKGNETVGIARQYCGETGKIDNCQSTVMVGYAGSHGYGLIDYELYMPKAWFSEEYAERRLKNGVPPNLQFKTKNEMALEMVTKIVESGKFPAKYIGLDAGFGCDYSLLDGFPKDMIYFADVHNDCKVFKENPGCYLPEYSGFGRKPSKLVTDGIPITVKELIDSAELPWERVMLGIGSKGPIFSEDKVRVVTQVRKGLPAGDVWLYARKLENGTIKYALCNAPMDTPKEELRNASLMRWSIEQCFHECKDNLGMNHCELRSWTGWHRHILFTFIAHLFIAKLRNTFSAIPPKSDGIPYTGSSVSSAEYLEAYAQLCSTEQINISNIHPKPHTPQQFLTIGLIQRAIWTIFVKTGRLVDELNYYLKSSRDAFVSHAKGRIYKEITATQHFGNQFFS
jgi:SRSO17 transposase